MGLSSACAGGVLSLGGFFPGRSPTRAASRPAGRGEHDSLLIQMLRARGCFRALFCLAEVESPSRLQTLPFSISMVTGRRCWWLCCPQRHQNNEAGASAVPRCGGFASQSPAALSRYGGIGHAPSPVLVEGGLFCPQWDKH